MVDFSVYKDSVEYQRLEISKLFITQHCGSVVMLYCTWSGDRGLREGNVVKLGVELKGFDAGMRTVV